MSYVSASLPLSSLRAFACVALIAGGSAAMARSPVQTEVIALPGLRQPVDVVMDRWGIPHSFARTDEDAFFAQGFNSARERLFQIDLWRRRGLGQLSEVLGPAYVQQDRATRLFLYRGDMEAEWGFYGAETRKLTARFVAGINAYIDWMTQTGAPLPYEFRKLNYRPAKWSVEDVVRIRTHGLTRNLTGEVERSKVLCSGSPAADAVRYRLEPPQTPQLPVGLDPCLPADVLKVFGLATQSVKVTPESLKSANAESVLLAMDANPEETSGSNNWVVAPQKSSTGRPIMANDPHRAFAAPSLRYLQQISSPSFNIIGAGEPSAPGLYIGHNGNIAYGLTIFRTDQEDLYQYDLKPGEPLMYRYRDGWEKMRVVHESVLVRGGAPVGVELHFTRHGPVIWSDGAKNRAYAVRTAWMDPGMSPYFASLRYLRAKNFPQFQAALDGWGAPSVNQVYADKNGNIGWSAAGLAPKRLNWDGLLPVPGDGRYEWAGYWSPRELPSTYNPPAGYFTSSNQMNLPPDYPVERRIGYEWNDRSRHERIDEVLKGLSKVSLEDSQRLQNDQLALPGRRLVALLMPLSSHDPDTQAALAMLKGWNAWMNADSGPAALFEVWISRHLGLAYKGIVLSKDEAASFGAPDTGLMLDTLEDPQQKFGDDAVAKRDALLLTTLKTAYADMQKLGGADPAQWQWGKLHTHTDEHAFAAMADPLMRDKMNVGPMPKGGSSYTPNQSTYRPRDFLDVNGPSFRVVVDVGNWDNSTVINTPGQSGDPESRHYRDLAPLWLNGQYVPLLYSRKAVEGAAEYRTRLVPTAQKKAP